MDACNNEIDTHHREFFSFNPSMFLADLSNIAMDVLTDGFDDLERALYESQSQHQEEKAAISKLLHDAYLQVLDSVNRAAGSFERYEQLTSLAVPAELYVEQPTPVLPEPVDPQQEQQLQQELTGLREQLLQARLKYRHSKQQLQQADKDASRAAARNAALKPLAEAISSRGAPLLDDASAISRLAAKLRPMVSRAQQLQAEQQEPMQQALAAGAGAGAGGGDAGFGGEDERRVRRVMAEAGASAEQLQAAAAALEAV
ncbi:hypothetical protein COO60DRAFT_1678405 [Scenedesmus sp. NREL 46B-D3]|nr:hypothetical protein COO60DRAFT_1678405 [Scenedesmus sp. NREL 46B-D3]